MASPQDPHPEIAKLLRIKRFESPPPGYFQRLPGQIRARIEAEAELEGDWLDRWKQWLAPFLQRPALAGANLLIVVGAGLLAAGLGRSLLRGRTDAEGALASQQPVFCYDIATAGPNLDRVLSSTTGEPGGYAVSFPVLPGQFAQPVIVGWSIVSNGSSILPFAQPAVWPTSLAPGSR